MSQSLLLQEATREQDRKENLEHDVLKLRI